jgi:class 3 adenylate cyclase
MFTDIVGYTALMGEDEQAAFELLKKNRSVQRPIIEKFNGRWLKEIGDGVLASFNAVSDAVHCAKAIQKACKNEPDLKLRIGIHEGEVVFEDNDVFGDGVNIASRLEPLAPIGGILVSEAVHKNVLNKKGITTILVGEKELRGVRESKEIGRIRGDTEKFG